MAGVVQLTHKNIKLYKVGPLSKRSENDSRYLLHVSQPVNKYFLAEEMISCERLEIVGLGYVESPWVVEIYFALIFYYFN